MNLKTDITLVYILLLPALVPEVASLWAQKSQNSFPKVAVRDIRYVDKAYKKKNVGSILTDLATTAVTGKSTTQHDEYAPSVREAIVKALSDVTRFRVIDGEFQVDELTSKEDALFVDGTINSITGSSQVTPSSVKDRGAQQLFKVLINVTLNLKDARTNETVNSRIFSITDSDISWMTTVDKAVNDAIGRLASRISDYYNHLYPLHGSIVERGEEKKDKQRTVYIDLGAGCKVIKGQQFNIYILKAIAGREGRQEIGRLKVEEVMGEDLSLCKVTKGEKEVKAALDQECKLVVINR